MKLFCYFSDFRSILPEMSVIQARVTSEADICSISVNYSQKAFRKSLSQLSLTNLIQNFFKYKMRTRPKIGVEAGIFFGEIKNLETRKIDLKGICLIETVSNHIIFDFYEIVFRYRSKLCLRIFYFIKIFSNQPLKQAMKCIGKF